MTQQEAVSYIADGHTWWKVEFAEQVCKAFGFELPKGMIETYKSQHEANPTNHFKGLFLSKDIKFPVSGVSSLPLSNYIVRKLGLEVREFLGRGFQAQANAEAVKEFINKK